MRWTGLTAVCIVTTIVSILVGTPVRDCRAQGVSVAPLRVLFDGRTRSTTVFLSNRTAETATYRISLINRRMLESGAIVPADEALDGEYFADELIRFSPRRVTIAPFGSQTIRLLVRRPRGDAPETVEYRTHLSVRSIPATPRLEDIESNQKAEEEGQLSVKAIATVETIIPVILRVGQTNASVQITNPELVLHDPESGFPTLTVDLVRGGNRSIYGEMEVVHVSSGGDETQLFFARGLAVYAPTTRRVKTVRLKKATPEMLQSGQLVVRYVETEDMHGDQSAQLVIPLGSDSIN